MTTHPTLDNQTTLTANPITQPKQIAVTSQLMQNYRLGTPFVAGSQIATAFNPAANQSEVFSVGNDGHVYNVYPDPGSDTGWTKADMNFPGQAKYVAAGAYPDGSTIVYAAGVNETIYAIRGGQKWGNGWQAVPALTSWPNMRVNFVGVHGLKVGYDTKNTPFVTMLFTFVDIWSHTVPAFATWSGNAWAWMGIPAVSPPVDWCTGFIQTPSAAGYPGVFASGQSDNDRTGVIAWVTNVNADVYLPLLQGPYTAIACAKNPKGFDQAFAVSTQDSGLYYLSLDPNAPWAQQLTPTKISGNTPVTAVAAGTGANGLMQAFALGADKHLYHTRQDSGPNNVNGWSALVQLDATLTFSQLIIGRDPATLAEVFAVTADARLYHVWQDATTTDWHVDEIELAQGGSLEEIRTFTAQMTVFDSNQVPVANTQVKIFSDAAIWLEVNGASCFVDRTTPWQGTTNALGQVMLGAPTDTLGLPALAVWTSLMPAADRIALDLSGPIQDALAGISDQQLLNAQVTDNQGNQTPLLAGAANRDPQTVASLAQAIQRTMGLATNAGAPAAAGAQNAAAPAQLFHPLNDHRVTTYLPNHDGGPLRLLHRPSIPDQHWQVDFSSGKPVFTDLTPDDAQRLLAEKRALPQAAFFLGLDIDWGDVFNAIVQGVASVVDYVVTTVSDAVQAVLTLVINGVTYVYDGIVKLVEQAFDLVEEVFKRVAVAFEQLSRWLGFIFNWQDILRSKEVIKYSIGEMFKFAQAVVPIARDRVIATIDGWERTIQQTFTSFINQYLGPQTSLSGYGGRTPIPAAQQADYHRAAGLNLFQSGFANNTGNVTTPTTGAAMALSADLTDVFDDMIAALSAHVTGFQSLPVFTQAVAYFKAIPSHPEAVVQLALSGLVTILEGIVLFALDAAKAVIQAVTAAILSALTMIANLLNEKWDIPLLSDLYASVAGSDLTALDLLAMMIALPGTMLYKVTVGAAPFPDAASVSAFQASFTSQSLLQRSGLSGASMPAAANMAVLQGGTDLQLVVEKFYQICSTITSGLYIFVDVALDATSITEDHRVQLAMGPVNTLALTLGWASWVYSFPWIGPDGGGVGCDTAEDFANLVWILQIIGLGIDTTFWVISKVKGQPATIARNSALGAVERGGLIVATIWGVANLGLAIAAAVKDGGQDVAGSGEGVLAAIPGACKWFTANWFMALTSDISFPVLLVLDGVCDTTAMLLSIAKITKSPEGMYPQQFLLADKSARKVQQLERRVGRIEQENAKRRRRLARPPVGKPASKTRNGKVGHKTKAPQ